ncbi:hypothetical protein M758_9G097500 [Ceratodon purpureus]|nr:hypothetical protein M758_9G097500 [Ceratodon purpureus]
MTKVWSDLQNPLPSFNNFKDSGIHKRLTTPLRALSFMTISRPMSLKRSCMLKQPFLSTITSAFSTRVRTPNEAHHPRDLQARIAKSLDCPSSAHAISKNISCWCG